MTEQMFPMNPNGIEQGRNQPAVWVTDEQVAAILAGLSACLAVQKEILQAVLNIRIGDDAIGDAVRRYEEKMAVVNGGVV